MQGPKGENLKHWLSRLQKTALSEVRYFWYYGGLFNGAADLMTVERDPETIKEIISTHIKIKSVIRFPD